MPKFSAGSEDNLKQVHPQLIELLNEAIKVFDFSVTDGVRTLDEQIKNVAKGVSHTMASKHLPQEDGLAHAVDIVPYPNDWSKVQKGLDAALGADKSAQVLRFYYLQGLIRGIAFMKGIQITQGVDWNRNTLMGDQTFYDLPHVELHQ